MSTATAPVKTRQLTDAYFQHPERFKQLDTVKQAEVVKHMYKELEKDQSFIAEKVGVSVPQVSNLQTIADLDDTLKKMISKGRVSGTLILQIIREHKDKTQQELAVMLTELYEQKQKPLTRKDFIKSVGKFQSLSIMTRFMNKVGRNGIKKNEVVYEFVSGLMEGNLDEKQIRRFFGLNK